MKMNHLTIWALLCLLAFSCSAGEEEPNKKPTPPAPSNKPIVGKVLPDWSDGYLDIHAVNTGRGECTLCIFPDGTTMLIDAAGSTITSSDAIPPPPAKPNASADPGQTIINYVSHFIKPASNKLNYILVSHWHADHIGGPPESSMPTHPVGRFKLFGLTKVASEIKFDKLIDRGLTYPKDLAATYPGVANYVIFANWGQTVYAATREEFKVGSASQIALQEANAAKYKNFQVRNIIGNGVVWTGSGEATKNTFPANVSDVLAASPDENIMSLGFHLKYGLFDFFAGGDLQYSGRSTHSWFDVEAPVAAVMPRVDVLKANHHGTANCNGDAFLNKLKPNAIIAHVWRDIQPAAATVQRMLAANSNCQIFTTNMTSNNMNVLGESITSKIKSMGGHVVVRVDPGGAKYYICVLDDTNEKYLVQKVFGPYSCN